MDGIYEGFETLTAIYKTVDNTSINVDVLIPKNLNAGYHPTIFRFHGGGFVSGSSLHPAFFPLWILELSMIMGAIIIVPNYRLLPESNVLDILEDMDDFWNWTHCGLDPLIASSLVPGRQADVTRILTVGESAGGYLSVQFAMDHVQDGVRACIAECPSLDLEAQAALGDPQNTSAAKSSGVPSQHEPPVVSDPTLSRFGIIDKLMQDGTFLNYFPDNGRVYPFRRLQNGAQMPPTFLIHGINDTTVPADQSIRFAKMLKQDPNAKVHLEIQPGEHLMDIALKLGHSWLMNGVRLVTGAWLGWGIAHVLGGRRLLYNHSVGIARTALLTNLNWCFCDV